MDTLRKAIASLSTGDYYQRPEDWFREVVLILRSFDCEVEPMLEINTAEGRSTIGFTGEHIGSIFYTWYRMPSKRFEIVCYVT
jgi:hypothetical protein